MTTILETTVKNNLCIGCGVCAGICPKHSLAMQWNQYGEYNPIKINDCEKECGLCLKVCPFADGNKNEDEIGQQLFGNITGISHRKETGYYLNSGVGGVASKEERFQSASGGLATWFLRQLLSERIVDGVICAVKTGDPDKLFKFTVARTDDEVCAATGSVYYPLELSEVVTYVLEHPGKYAVVALPCFVKALRLAQNKNKILQERVVLIISLTCGKLVTSHFAKYIGYCSGLNEDIASLHFRLKSVDNPSNSYVSKLVGVTGNETTISWNKENLWFSWNMLSHNACNCCDDVFGECADVTFMDAWLPEYRQKPEGTSLWISRSPIVDDVFAHGIENEVIDAALIPIEKVIESQTQNGLINKKKHTLSYCLKLLAMKGHSVPQKRVPMGELPVTWVDRHKCKRHLLLMEKAKLELVSCGYDYNHMQKWFAKNAKDTIIIRSIVFSFAAFNFALRKIGIRHT